MGLDVYLYRHAMPLEELDRLEADAEKRGELIAAEVLASYGAKQWSDLPEAKRRDYFAETERRYTAAGLSKYGGLANDTEQNRKIELPSTIDADHYFKIGYFRSSYNSGGLNSVMRRAGLGSLSDVFEVGERYRFIPDWSAALVRAKSLAEQYDAHMQRSGGVDVLIAESNPFTRATESCSTEKDALDIYLGQRAKYEPRPGGDFSTYSMRDGEFWMGDAMRVRAIIHGIHDSFAGPRPCHYVVYEKETGPDWYATAWKIVIETIEWVLAQPDPQHYALHWSG